MEEVCRLLGGELFLHRNNFDLPAIGLVGEHFA